VKDFFVKSEALMYACDHQERLHLCKKIPFIGWLLYFFITNKKFLFYGISVVTMLINIIVLSNYRTDFVSCPEPEQQPDGSCTPGKDIRKYIWIEDEK
jgi:hypothetical protein